MFQSTSREFTDTHHKPLEFKSLSRSFCNGPYFRDFRRMFLEMMALDQIHLFESRQEAFSDDTYSDSD
ncbi:hypothetical protein FD723_22485 [Nostoc sp. C052]|nr:hypothetical protein FD723_22485 [Nostoc sp. C052]